MISRNKNELFIMEHTHIVLKDNTSFRLTLRRHHSGLKMSSLTKDVGIKNWEVSSFSCASSILHIVQILLRLFSGVIPAGQKAYLTSITNKGQSLLSH